MKIAYHVALGLGAAHSRGIVYRNVKPRKILLGRDGSIKLTDLSIANMHDMKQYYSPELAQGEIVTPPSDIYSLGIIMYEMLTARVPFDSASPEEIISQHIHNTPKPPSQLNPNIPTALEKIIMRCLEKEPEMRYRNGSELARALEALM
jgi:serine/threonine-protein kinase